MYDYQIVIWLFMDFKKHILCNRTLSIKDETK